MSQSTLVRIGNFSLVTVGIHDVLDRLKFIQQQFSRVVGRVPSATFNKAAFVSQLMRNDRKWRLVEDGDKLCYDSVVVLTSNMTAWGYNLSVYRGSSVMGHPDWQGNLSKFSDYIASLEQDDETNDSEDVDVSSELIGRTVRFCYNAGHAPGENRIVKVTKLDDYHLAGVDMISDAPRTYRLDRIDGPVKIIG